MTTETDSSDADVVSYCSRCHCSVPLDEWELVGSSFRHKGPMRDHRVDRFVGVDEEGGDRCGWMKRIPEKIT